MKPPTRTAVGQPASKALAKLRKPYHDRDVWTVALGLGPLAVAQEPLTDIYEGICTALSSAWGGTRAIGAPVRGSHRCFDHGGVFIQPRCGKRPAH